MHGGEEDKAGPKAALPHSWGPCREGTVLLDASTHRRGRGSCWSLGHKGDGGVTGRGPPDAVPFPQVTGFLAGTGVLPTSGLGRPGVHTGWHQGCWPSGQMVAGR